MNLVFIYLKAEFGSVFAYSWIEIESNQQIGNISKNGQWRYWRRRRGVSRAARTKVPAGGRSRSRRSSDVFYGSWINLRFFSQVKTHLSLPLAVDNIYIYLWLCMWIIIYWIWKWGDEMDVKLYLKSNWNEDSTVSVTDICWFLVVTVCILVFSLAFISIRFKVVIGWACSVLCGAWVWSVCILTWNDSLYKG